MSETGIRQGAVAGESHLKIGDVARVTGKTVRTIRYYEEKRLLAPRGHTEGGFRLYTQADVDKIEMISQLRELGFSLEEIGRIFGAWGGKKSGDDVAREFGRLTRDGLERVRRKIVVLKQLDRQIRESLKFLEGCCGCRETPDLERCEGCAEGDGRKSVPGFIETIIK